MKEKVKIRVTTTRKVMDHWEALAERRYGDASQKSLDKVAQDACQWLLTKWQNGEFYFYDWFWRMVTLCPIKRVAAVGWGKLVFERYLAW